MDEREKMIRLWFSMWLEKKDLGIDDIFAENVIYTESWGPCYRNREIVKHWFQEWNTRGSVIAWDIKQFFHKGNQTAVEWYFKNIMDNGDIEEFDGISLIEWSADPKAAPKIPHALESSVAIFITIIRTKIVICLNLEKKKLIGSKYIGFYIFSSACKVLF